LRCNGYTWNTIVDNVGQFQFNGYCPEYLCNYLASTNHPDIELLFELSKARMKKRDQCTNIFSEKKEYPKKEYDVSPLNENLLLPRMK
jgi:hypothetical protein